MRDFHIGDKVRYVPKPSGHITPLSDAQSRDLMARPYGTVRGFFEKYVAVEFEQISTGHFCNGSIPSWKGMYVDPQELDYISNTKVISISKLI